MHHQRTDNKSTGDEKRNSPGVADPPGSQYPSHQRPRPPGGSVPGGGGVGRVLEAPSVVFASIARLASQRLLLAVDTCFVSHDSQCDYAGGVRELLTQRLRPILALARALRESEAYAAWLAKHDRVVVVSCQDQGSHRGREPGQPGFVVEMELRIPARNIRSGGEQLGEQTRYCINARHLEAIFAAQGGAKWGCGVSFSSCLVVDTNWSVAGVACAPRSSGGGPSPVPRLLHGQGRLRGEYTREACVRETIVKFACWRHKTHSGIVRCDSLERTLLNPRVLSVPRDVRMKVRRVLRIPIPTLPGGAFSVVVDRYLASPPVEASVDRLVVSDADRFVVEVELLCPACAFARASERCLREVLYNFLVLQCYCLNFFAMS
jgi:hypothetical protein